jgi:membrane-associated phospholipid phosphatase
MAIIQFIFDYIGSSGPYLLNILSIILLCNKQVYLLFYIIGYIINTIVNLSLKNMIKDPRPNQDKVLFELGLTHGKRHTLDKYGMPSGHAQGVGYSTMFIYLVLGNVYILWLYSFVTILTMMQRYKYRNHTIPQIIMGLLIGLLAGYVVYMLSRLFTKGKLTCKKDDNCYIL